jgi:ligand-binding SRPBCC domain-containing protein
MAYLLEREQFLPRPIGEVFEFFSDARNLEALTPTWLSFRILTPAPIQMAEGAVLEYELRWRFFGVKWRTEIASWQPPHRFCDVQVKGPYKLWRHTHSFRAVAGGTMMSDRVEYELPFGPLGTLAHALRVRRDLDRIFDYRRSAIIGALEGRTASS